MARSLYVQGDGCETMLSDQRPSNSRDTHLSPVLTNGDEDKEERESRDRLMLANGLGFVFTYARV